MTRIIEAPIVGMHFRPPAKQVIHALPAGTALRIVPEPDNPYDEKALRVEVHGRDISLDADVGLIEALEGTGHQIEDLFGPRPDESDWEPPAFHLGYVADSDGAVIRKIGGAGNREIAACGVTSGRLGWSADGQPMIQVEVKVGG